MGFIAPLDLVPQKFHGFLWDSAAIVFYLNQTLSCLAVGPDFNFHLSGTVQKTMFKTVLHNGLQKIKWNFLRLHQLLRNFIDYLQLIFEPQLLKIRIIAHITDLIC